MNAEVPKKRVVLIGLGPTTLSALEGLVDEFDVVALIRDGDDSTTRRAFELTVPVRTDASLRGVRGTIEELQPDAVVVSSFNRILDAELVSRCTFINVHYAPLPRGRGRATVNWALINGDTETAISIHLLVPGLDAGGILFQAPVAIGPESTVTSLYAELNELLRRNIGASLRKVLAGDPGEQQDESKATYYCTRTPADGEIDWNKSTAEIDRLIRALQAPFPLAFTWLDLRRIEIVEAGPVSNPHAFSGRIPGRVVRVDRSNRTADVLTGDGVLRVRTVKPAGGSKVEASTVFTSVSATLGLSMRDLVSMAVNRVLP